MKWLATRVRVFDRAWYLRDLVRVAEAANYSARMRAAGVPDKNRLKILRRWRPLPYAMRREMSALVEDMRRRFHA